jgi:hypothetical protein
MLLFFGVSCFHHSRQAKGKKQVILSLSKELSHTVRLSKMIFWAVCVSSLGVARDDQKSS